MKIKPSQIVCSSCQKIMNKSYSYCPTCRAYVHKGDEPVSFKNIMLRFIASVCIILLTIALIVYFKYYNGYL